MAIKSHPKKPRVMVDTSVLLPGIIWPRWPSEILQHALRQEIQLVLSNFLIVEAVGKFEEKFPKHAQDFKLFLEDCDYELVPDPSFESVTANQDLMKDIFDVPIALAAINAQVDYFISQDKHFTEPIAETANLHARLPIMLAGTFLREVMGWSSETLEEVRQRPRPAK